MLNPNTMLEATRLTRAGRLIEATALLQRMLRGETAPDMSFGSAGDNALAGRSRQSLTPRRRPLTGRIVRSSARPRPPGRTGSVCYALCPTASGVAPRSDPGLTPPAGSTPDIVPAGGKFIEVPITTRRKPDLQALHSQPLSGAGTSSRRHASRLHPVAGRFRCRHPHESVAEEQNCLVVYPEQPRRQIQRSAGIGFARVTSGGVKANLCWSPASPARSCAPIRSTPSASTSGDYRPAGPPPPSWARLIPICMRLSGCIPALPVAPPATFPPRSSQCDKETWRML